MTLKELLEELRKQNYGYEPWDAKLQYEVLPNEQDEITFEDVDLVNYDKMEKTITLR